MVAAVTGRQVGTMVAGFAAVMGILMAVHSQVVVPQILAAAENRAHELAAGEAELVRQELRQRVMVAEAMHATYVTRSELDQLTRSLDLMQSQLDRIEARITK